MKFIKTLFYRPTFVSLLTGAVVTPLGGTFSCETGGLPVYNIKHSESFFYQFTPCMTMTCPHYELSCQSCTVVQQDHQKFPVSLKSVS